MPSVKGGGQVGQLFFFYGNAFQFIHLRDEKSMTIGNDFQHDLTIQAFTMESPITIKQTKQNQLEVWRDEVFAGNLNSDETDMTLTFEHDQLRISYTDKMYDKQAYYIGNQLEVNLPHVSEPACQLVKNEKNWSVIPINQKDIYCNGEKILDKQLLSNGDSVFFNKTFFTLADTDILEMESQEPQLDHLIKMKKPDTVLKQKYPNYRRTPRMIYEQPDEKVAFSFPNEEHDDNGKSLWMVVLPPIIMLLVMGVVALVRPRGIFILISLAMFGTTLVTSTVQYFKEKRNQKRRKEKRRRLYTRYLEKKRKDLQRLSDKQRHVLYYHFPSFERMKYLTGEISERIWERSRLSSDFLHFRAGRATIPSSYDVTEQRADMTNQEIDDLVEKSQELLAHYKYVRDVPLVIDISRGAMGMIGKRDVVNKEIQQIVGQLSFSQSYHDIRMVAIFDEGDYSEWEWMKWLPHFQLPNSYARGLIYNEQTRDQLLSSIYEMLKERDLIEDKEKKMFTPHFIFIVTNRQLISEHAILEYLESDHPALGFSVIFAEDTKESLSEHIHTLIRYIDETEGDILIQQHKAEHLPFKLDKHRPEGNETFSRMLRSLNHQLGMSNSIPEKVTFLDLFETEKAEELGIQQKWLENQSSKSLAVPVGLKSKDDHVYLNLHERAHGPHGLLAGTTGSGKSEFLQAYILSLAVHFHPHEVAFLLIDYKGGGMAQPFRKIPHLLGTITNIEGSKNFSNRALASIKSELKRRQRLFDQYSVNHINNYTDLYKEGEAAEPMPHLFLISDEFAELKSEEPEFIKELVSAARIGRSLGVHLILATQKPGGIIDDQIWSNSRFKVALKVQDESDSKEILKNSDAANITVTGRGYLQVGNNEVYELFQSAWSGAPYVKDAFGTEEDVALVTDLGLIPLSEVAPEEKTTKERVTEIDAVTEEIAAVQERMGIKKLASPWLPPLPERARPSAENVLEPGTYPIGIVDEPERQSQSPYAYQTVEDGNIGIFGSSGYGKSTTLQTLLMAMAVKNSPEQVQYYVFDFGNGALLPFQQLPHTGDYFRSDDKRKIEKFLSFIAEEVDKRKQLFTVAEVSNITMYNTISDVKLPLIFITIDNYDLVKEEMLDYENNFISLVRDGQSLGIYMALTATRSNSVKHALMSNLKTKIVHYMMDETEKHALIGRTTYETEAVPGRAYIKKETAYLTHMYLPVDGDDDMAVMENLKGTIRDLKVKYEGSRKPKAIPMLPRELGWRSFHEHYGVIEQPNQLAIGLDEATVEPVYMDFNINRHCLIMGDAQKGKTNILKMMIHRISESSNGGHIALFDSVNRSLSDYAGEDGISYIETKEQISEWVASVEQEFSQRELIYRTSLKDKEAPKPDKTPHILMVDGNGNFLQTIDAGLQMKLGNLIKSYSHLGFSVVISGGATEFSKGFDQFTNELKQIKQAILLMKQSEQTIFTLPYKRNEPDVKPGFGYYLLNGDVRKIQIPYYNLERVASK
jgi:S-DNA-T family DNA segregation ATPase FtsK/SpoIIIE